MYSSFLYKFVKLLLILWLTHPDYLGAFYLYHRTNERLFERHKDAFLERLYLRVTFLTGVSHRMLERLENI